MGQFHDFYAPSASSRWLECTASLSMDISHLQPKTNYSAELGTALHEAGEQLVLGQITYGKLAGMTFNGIKIERDHVNNILRPYADFVKRQCDEGVSHTLYTEFRSVLTEKCSGTADAVILIKKKNGKYTLKVIDLKTGAGTKVSPIDNSQLMIYAAGVLRSMELIYDIDKIQVGICQPPFDVYAMVDITIDELDAFAERVEDVIEKIEAGDVKFSPSESTCQWCPAASICPKLNDLANEAAKFDYEKVPATSMKSLTQQMQMVPLVRLWANAVEAESSARLLAGKKMKDFKLVRGRSSRSWKFNEDTLVKKLKALGVPKAWAYVSKLASPPQLEKLLKDKGRDDKKISKLIRTDPGGPVVVPESDSREAYCPHQEAKKDFS